MPVRRGRNFRGGSWPHTHLLRRGIRASLGAEEEVPGPSFPALDGYTYSHDLTDTTGANGLDPILDVVSPTGRSLNGSIHFSDDGLHVVAASDLAGKIATFSLSTAFDLSTASQVGTTWDAEFSNPWTVAFDPTGNYLIRQPSTDEITVFHLTTQWQISDSPTDTEHSAIGKAAMGGSGSADGPFWISRDGLYVYAMLQDASNNTVLSVMPLNTAWDLSDTGTLSSLNVEADINTIQSPFQSGIKFSDDGLTCWYWDGGGDVMYQAVLNTAWTPADGATITSDSTTYPNLAGTNQEIFTTSWDMSRLLLCKRLAPVTVEVWTQ